MDMTCKDCAHCHVCGFAKEIGSDKAVKMFDFKCPDFQNKADVVNVVRCKDCKYLMLSDYYGECSKRYMGIVLPDDYCSYGERKDDK